MKIALVGSPNSGKTTLFNRLTGSRQRTANYAGVTVEKKEGFFLLTDSLEVSLIDLPGTYSLDAKTQDEKIATDIITGNSSLETKPQVLLAVADSTNIHRNLYLVLQLKELGIPMVLALTMTDLAKKNGIAIDFEKLEKKLGIPIVPISALKGTGISELKKKIETLGTVEIKSSAPFLTDNSSSKIIERYKFIEEAVKESVHNTTPQTFTASVDKILLNKVFGPILLFSLLLILFQLIFSFATIPMDLIQKGFDLLGQAVQTYLPEGFIQSLLTKGVIKGVGSVLVFLPQILILFFFIYLLEDTGLMARAAFILDRFMKFVGLSGRSFIPLLSSFACAIPGIMSTRTIDSKKDKLITILIIPLMTCSARLPVYSILIASFIPATKLWGPITYQGMTLMGLYLFGIFTAMVVALILKLTLHRKEKSFFVMELPTYKAPSFKNLAHNLKDRALLFLRRAGTIILYASVVLWFLATYPKSTPPENFTAQQKASYGLEHSVLGRLGKSFEPAIRPIGFDWKIGIGLLSSFAAREVIVSTMSTVYAINYSKDDEEKSSSELSNKLKQDPNMSLPTALSLLVFFALACQCISTIAIVRRETNSWRWPIFMFSYMTILAYVASFAVYHGAKFFLNT